MAYSRGLNYPAPLHAYQEPPFYSTEHQIPDRPVRPAAYDPRYIPRPIEPVVQNNHLLYRPEHSSYGAIPASSTQTWDNNMSQITQGTTQKRRRDPDWDEFYGKGLPKEVIVIHDTPTPPPTKRQRVIPPSEPAKSLTQVPSIQHDSETRTNTSDASTDRTTSALQTTAETSLGSINSQNDLLTKPSAKKRAATTIKRQTTAVTAAPRTRRTKQQVDSGKAADKAAQKAALRAARLAEFATRALDHYHVPPKPALKAPELRVPIVRVGGAAAREEVDDKEGHYLVQADSLLGRSYSIRRLLGQGTFGKVVEAEDVNTGGVRAIKIIRAVPKYRDASKIELRVLETLKLNDPQNKNKCIHLREAFDFRNHICIVTDLLSSSIFDFLKENAFTPFPSSHIQDFAKQLLTSVAYLHDLQLIHTDLKPENILLEHNQYQTFTYSRAVPTSSSAPRRQPQTRKVLLGTGIRLIDFGSATFQNEYHSQVVSTRHYRAPEIILGLGWSFPCDIWSIGCILVEFLTGDALFQTHDNLEHLAMMEAVVGRPIEPKLVRKVTQNKSNNRRDRDERPADYFKRLKLHYPREDTPKSSKRFVKAMKKLKEIIVHKDSFNKEFLDLLEKILVYDPEQRLTAKECLQHPWFQEAISDDGTECRRLTDEAVLRNTMVVNSEDDEGEGDDE